MKPYEHSAREIREEGPSLSPEFVAKVLKWDEREHIKAKIQAKQAEVSRLLGEIRWLKLELEPNRG